MKNGEGKVLPLILILALAMPSSASEIKKLPDFSLDSVRISGLPKLPDGAIPPVPPPTDTGYYRGAGAGGVRMNSGITVVVEGETGRADITFPTAEYSDEYSGFRSSLFINFSAHNAAAVLSWAAVICSGQQYLGYKGASLKLPDSSGVFVIKDEALSLGPMKALVGRTHPWVIPAAGKDGFQGARWCSIQGTCSSGKGQNLDRLCSADFPAKMKAYNIKALPREADGFSFNYDQPKNALTVTWHR